MSVISAVTNDNGNVLGYSFFCRGCQETHVFWTSGKLVWHFNGDASKPSFSPSLLNTWTNHDEGVQERCHLFMTDGVISYCTDCTHSLAGTSYQLEERL